MLRWFEIHEYINPHSGLEIIQRTTRIVKYKAYLITKTLKLHNDLNTLFYNHGPKVLNCVFHWQLCCYPVIFLSICLQPKSKFLYIDSAGCLFAWEEGGTLKGLSSQLSGTQNHSNLVLLIQVPISSVVDYKTLISSQRAPAKHCRDYLWCPLKRLICPNYQDKLFSINENIQTNLHPD